MDLGLALHRAIPGMEPASRALRVTSARHPWVLAAPLQLWHLRAAAAGCFSVRAATSHHGN